MYYKPKWNKKAMLIRLKKPIYKCFYAVWDRWIKTAKEKGLRIIIKTPCGTARYRNANEFLKGAKKLKRFYKNENEPMVFYGRDIKKDVEKQKKKEKREQDKISFINTAFNLEADKIREIREVIKKPKK